MPVINGTTGEDSIVGTSGADTINGNGGGDIIDGAGGNDSITGGAPIDYISGGSGSDTVNGGDGEDHIWSGTSTPFDPANQVTFWDLGLEVDVLNGGGGRDWIVGGYGDVIDGGLDYDYFSISYLGLGFGISVDFRGLDGQPFSTGGVSLNGVEEILDLQGTNYDDVLCSTGEALQGMGGNDHIIGARSLDGGSGDDLIEVAANSWANAFGGTGNDTLIGGAGFDTLAGGDGDDLIVGGQSADSLDGGDGNDTISGSPGSDTVQAGAGNDSISAGDGNDRILAGDGNDTVDAGAGMNWVETEDGDDIVYAGDGAATLSGGAGFDTLSYEKVSYAVNIAIGYGGTKQDNHVEDVRDFEKLVGTAFDDTLSGYSHYYVPPGTAYTLEGAHGDDVIYGRSGNDVLYGDGEVAGSGDGDDTLDGGEGDDTLVGGDGIDTAAYAYKSNDYSITYHAASGTFTVAGLDGADTLFSIERLQFSDVTLEAADLKSNPDGGGDDSLSGTSGADALAGHAGNDTLVGGAGNDTLDGGLGDDWLDGGTENDTASYADAIDGVTVSLALAGAQDTGSAGRDTLTSIENLEGGRYSDSLAGDDAANILSGGSGYDTLDGGGGIDTLAGGDDNDVYYVDSSQDVIQETEAGGIGDTVISSAYAYDLPEFVEGITIAPGGVYATGNSLDNWMYGNTAGNFMPGEDGNDSIYGGGGADSLDGGAGDDELYADGIYDQGADARGQRLVGGAGNDLLYGGWGDDTLVGDSFQGSVGAGDDTMDGAEGIDTARYAGDSSQYAITGSGNAYTVTGPDGTDTLTNIEYLAFADRTIGIEDTTVPKLVSITPEAGATGILPGTPIVLTFDEPVQGGDGYVEVVAGTNIQVWALKDYASGTTFVLNPHQDWDPATVYTIRVMADAARDASGNSIAESSTTFATEWIGVNITAYAGGATGFGADDTLTGGSLNDFLDGQGGNDLLYGGGGNDALAGRDGNDYIDGGAGYDAAFYDGLPSAYTVRVSAQQKVVSGAEGTDTLVGVERLDFADSYHMTFDIDGTAGMAYRLYQAAFNRKPDLGGLGYQMHDLDIGFTLEQVAANFIASPEFQRTYGNVNDTQFLTLLYNNVLHRGPDSGGLQFHLDEFARGESRAEMLIHFSESPENQANVIGDIQDGIVYIW